MRKRAAGINVRVTPSEKRRMEQRARHAGLTLSEYLRKRALGYAPKFHPPREFFGVLTYLENLTDQLERYDPPLAREYRACADQIREIVLWKGGDADGGDQDLGSAG